MPFRRAMLPLLALLAAAQAAAATPATLNPALSRSFYGLAYSPDGVILPDCGGNQSEVDQDILLIAQLTPRIHLYGGDCNQTALVLQAIQNTNADLTVYLGIDIPVPLNQSVVDRQFTAIQAALKTYGTKNIAGITVGNEFLLDSYGINNPSALPNDTAGIAARTQLLSTIKSINTTLVGMKLPTHIPVGTSDAGSALTAPLCTGIDYYLANVHPWFGDLPIDQAAGWTWEYFQENEVQVCKSAKNNPQMMIGETGWPTANGTDGPSDASIANLQTYLDDFVCQANTNSTPYFFFEFKDEPWKAIYGGVETHWGLFNDDRTVKSGLTMPNCPVTSPLGGTVSQLITPASAGGSSSGGSSAGSSNSSNSSTSTASAASSLSIGWTVLAIVLLALMGA